MRGRIAEDIPERPGSTVLSRREFLAAAGVALATPLLVPAVTWTDPAIPAADVSPGLESFIHRQMQAARVPGLGASIVKEGRIAWARGYGLANITRNDGADADTDFMLASISKTVMAVAVMRAVEDGLIDLDADVNDVLPFAVRNPSHQNEAITTRMLLTHTSSIRDRYGVWGRPGEPGSLYANGDSTISLGTFLEGYLVPGGTYWVDDKNFYAFAPGDAYQYSNIAAALAGFLVESASGTPFDQWCEDRIFTPLHMPQTSWHLGGLDRKNVAMPYGWKHGGYVPYGQYGYPDYPDGALRTTPRELAHHLLAFINFGEYHGVRILQEDTVREMRRSQIPDLVKGQGLIWYVIHLNGQRLMGHNGGDFGVATQMYFRPGDGTGVMVLANGNWRRSGGHWPLSLILNRLFVEADRL